MKLRTAIPSHFHLLVPAAANADARRLSTWQMKTIAASQPRRTTVDAAFGTTQQLTQKGRAAAGLTADAAISAFAIVLTALLGS
jgi:hypothetical protein